MVTIRRAVIDVGTNSVKLLVAEVEGNQVCPVVEQAKQTRLGKGFFETHRLQPEPIARTAQAVSEFAAQARGQGAVSIRVIATSAARDAVNGAELASAIQEAAGLTVEIISGDQEADLGFQGVSTDPALAASPLLLLEVGGGSTQFILGEGGRKLFRQSFRLGAVRLMERIPHGDPPQPQELAAVRKWLRNFLRTEVEPVVKPALVSAGSGTGKQIQLLGTGGTASILGRMEAKLETFAREQLEQTRLSAARLCWHVEHLWSLPLEHRRKVPGLPAERADVILTGAAIYEAVLEEFGIAELRITTRGLRFGALMGPGG